MVSIPVAADMGGVASAHHLEIPIVGPGRANLLVITDGIAIPDLDVETQVTHFDVFIDTDYKLRDTDVLIDSSAYVTLSTIDVDDTLFLLALDSTEVNVRTSKVILLKVSGAIEGDTGLRRIGYQVNLLIMRTG